MPPVLLHCCGVIHGAVMYMHSLVNQFHSTYVELHVSQMCTGSVIEFTGQQRRSDACRGLQWLVAQRGNVQSKTDRVCLSPFFTPLLFLFLLLQFLIFSFLLVGLCLFSCPFVFSFPLLPLMPHFPLLSYFLSFSSYSSCSSSTSSSSFPFSSSAYPTHIAFSSTSSCFCFRCSYVFILFSILHPSSTYAAISPHSLSTSRPQYMLNSSCSCFFYVAL